MLSLGYRYVYAIVMSIAGLALCLHVSENAALERCFQVGGHHCFFVNLNN